MIYTEKVKIGIKDIEKNNFLSNKAILEYFENTACHHSDSLGYGISEMEKTGLGWILLEWKIKVIKRVKYGQEATINTWSRSMERCYGLRDFELYDENGELCVIATSKWLLLNTKKGTIARADDEMKIKYDSELQKDVFENEKFEKIDVPDNVENEIVYKITRRDIDIMGHMHNLYYLDLAYESLPDDIYEKQTFDNVRISYKKEIKYGENIVCQYSTIDNKKIVVIKNEDRSTIHAIIELF